MTLSDDFLRIDTPENVVFGYEVAGIGSRFLAAMVDTLLILVLQLIVNFGLALLLSTIFSDFFDEDSLAWVAAIFGLLSFAFLWGYYVFFEIQSNGQSPGKQWVGLRVIRNDGTPLTLVESIIRNIVRLVDFLPIYYGVGVVVMFVDKQTRRLGDLAAGTLVVHDRETIDLADLRKSPMRTAPSQEMLTFANDLPLERLSGQDFQMIEEFLYRRSDFANRQSLARQLTLTLFEQMTHEVDMSKFVKPRFEDILVAMLYVKRQEGGGET